MISILCTMHKALSRQLSVRQQYLLLESGLQPLDTRLGIIS